MKLRQLFFAVFAFLFLTGVAEAGTTGALPWEGPLRTIAQPLTGPLLGGGGKRKDSPRRAALLGLIVAVLVFATNILSSAFGVTGALI